MDDDKGLSLGVIMVGVVLAAVGLWVVWGFLGFLFSAVKAGLTLAVVALVLYGVYRGFRALERAGD